MPHRTKRTIRRRHKVTKRRTRRHRGGNMLEVFYGEQQVAGQELSRQTTMTEPTVKFPNTGKHYTLVMWDPDVPSQFQPGWAHWIATNLMSPNDIRDNLVLDYKGPSPPSGTHRYYFGLFEQQQHISPQQPTRNKFDIDEFTRAHNLVKVHKVFMKVSASAGGLKQLKE